MRMIAEVGNTYGQLKVVARGGKRHGLYCWICECSCGNTTEVRGAQLRMGRVKSCGCLQRKVTGDRVRSHGMSKTKAYRSYAAAKKRCTNPASTSFESWGGRGIEFRLPPFEDFWAAMGPTWFEGGSIERIDNDGHYELGNVRWATQREQMNNTRRSRWVTYQGRTLTIAQWARELGVPRTTLVSRLKMWPLERAMQPKQITERNNHAIEN